MAMDMLETVAESFVDAIMYKGDSYEQVALFCIIWLLTSVVTGATTAIAVMTAAPFPPIHPDSKLKRANMPFGLHAIVNNVYQWLLSGFAATITWYIIGQLKNSFFFLKNI